MTPRRNRSLTATCSITADVAEFLGLPRDRTVIMGSRMQVRGWTTVELRAGADFTGLARAILARERQRLDALLPHPHELMLVGGSSLPGTLTKGDVDLHLRVSPAAFEPVVTRLRDVYEVVLPEIWQPTLATFAAEAALPTGVAVTPTGSGHDLRFTRTWQRLAADPALVEAYNDLKLHHRDDPDEYERRKSAFFDSLLEPP